jgi:hypothetical protein
LFCALYPICSFIAKNDVIQIASDWYGSLHVPGACYGVTQRVILERLVAQVGEAVLASFQFAPLKIE